ncbi:MAG: PKD domain-containing protein [Euryarchaeota archaeon]|nr:PKD domain-containing protein [Euryarchaeota archaeon]
MDRSRSAIALCALVLTCAIPPSTVTGDTGPPAPGDPEIGATDRHRRVIVWRLNGPAGYQLAGTAVTAGGAELAFDNGTGQRLPYGTVTTRDLVLENLVRWDRLDTDSTVPGGCGILLLVSTDGGESWRSVHENGSLAKARPESGKIRVRAELRSTDPQSTPVLSSLWLEAAVDLPPQILSLECPKGTSIYKRDQTVINSRAVDPDGDELTYAWSQVEGPAARLGRTDQPSLAFTPYYNGPHTFRLTVSDGYGANRSADITLNVGNHPPVVYLDMAGTPYKDTQLHIFATTFSADASLVDYNWTLLVAPPFTTMVQPTKPDIVLHSFFTGPCTVELTVTDDEGTKGRGNLSFEFIGHPPSARLFADRRDGHAGQEYRFIASASTDIDGDRLEYRFDFGDGMVTDWVHFSDIVHIFETQGQYTVRVSVRDVDGMLSEAQCTVRVRARNQPPSASFIVTPGDLAVPFEFVSTSTDADGSITAAEWTFGDGGSASGLWVTHLFASPGDYTVRLWVRDDDEASSFATATININRPPSLVMRNPPGDVAISPAQGLNLSVEAVDPDGDPLSYSWTVNGLPLEGENASSHRFVPGKESGYRITVLVDDGRGGGANYTWNLTVMGPVPPPPPPVYTILYLILAILAAQGLYLARRPLGAAGRRLWRLLPARTEVLSMDPPPAARPPGAPPPEARPVMEGIPPPGPFAEAPVQVPVGEASPAVPYTEAPAALPLAWARRPAQLARVPEPEPLAEVLRPEERPRRYRPRPPPP